MPDTQIASLTKRYGETLLPSLARLVAEDQNRGFDGTVEVVLTYREPNAPAPNRLAACRDEYEVTTYCKRTTCRDVQILYVAPSAHSTGDHGRPSSPRASILASAGHIMTVVDKDNITRMDLAPLTSCVLDTCGPQLEKGLDVSPITVVIGGYDHDERELWDIPDVVHWFQALHQGHGFIPYFLTPGSVQLYFGILESSVYQFLPHLVPFGPGKQMVALLSDVFIRASTFFKERFPDALPQVTPFVDKMTKKLERALGSLLAGWQEPV